MSGVGLGAGILGDGLSFTRGATAGAVPTMEFFGHVEAIGPLSADVAGGLQAF